MIDRTVARRYAEAFVNTLEKSRRLEPGLEGLKFASQTYVGSRDLQRFLGSPEIGPEEKERLLARLLSDTVGTEGMGLIDLLLKWDRVDHLPAISEEARRAAEIRQGILRGQVATARPISSSETEAIARAVGQLLGKRVLLERQVDPQLIGGVRVVVGTSILDGSIQTLLKQIREQLLAAKVS